MTSDNNGLPIATTTTSTTDRSREASFHKWRNSLPVGHGYNYLETWNAARADMVVELVREMELKADTCGGVRAEAYEDAIAIIRAAVGGKDD